MTSHFMQLMADKKAAFSANLGVLRGRRSRRSFLKAAALAPVSSAILSPSVVSSASGVSSRVRDRLWAWAHDAHCYDNLWGLPANGRMTPVEGAFYLGVPNVIFVRYEGKPEPPFEQYAIPFRPLQRVEWSITGASGRTSEDERERVFRLAQSMPNLTGVFLDDFFKEGDGRRQWLADNHPEFPVYLELHFNEAAAVTCIELTQTDWLTGDYLSGDFRVEYPAGQAWATCAEGRLGATRGSKTQIRLDGRKCESLRIAFINSQDETGAQSCGLSGIRVLVGDAEVPHERIRIAAASHYPGHEPEELLKTTNGEEARAALTTAQLRAVRSRLALPDGRVLSLGVTLYSHQLAKPIRAHLDLCDLISLWTWKARDLNSLPTNLDRLRALAPGKKIRLGCYMWDFGTSKPITVAQMKQQCEFALVELQAGRIEGIIFLATNICDLGIEAVEWTREWIARVGEAPLG